MILALDGLFKQELLLVIDPIMITMGLYPQDISFYFVFFEQGKKLANKNGLYFLFKY